MRILLRLPVVINNRPGIDLTFFRVEVHVNGAVEHVIKCAGLRHVKAVFEIRQRRNIVTNRLSNFPQCPLGNAVGDFTFERGSKKIASRVDVANRCDHSCRTNAEIILGYAVGVKSSEPDVIAPNACLKSPIVGKDFIEVGDNFIGQVIRIDNRKQAPCNFSVARIIPGPGVDSVISSLQIKRVSPVFDAFWLEHSPLISPCRTVPVLFGHGVEDRKPIAIDANIVG